MRLTVLPIVLGLLTSTGHAASPAAPQRLVKPLAGGAAASPLTRIELRKQPGQPAALKPLSHQQARSFAAARAAVRVPAQPAATGPAGQPTPAPTAAPYAAPGDPAYQAANGGLVLSVVRPLHAASASYAQFSFLDWDDAARTKLAAGDPAATFSVQYPSWTNNDTVVLRARFAALPAGEHLYTLTVGLWCFPGMSTLKIRVGAKTFEGAAITSSSGGAQHSVHVAYDATPANGVMHVEVLWRGAGFNLFGGGSTGDVLAGGVVGSLQLMRLN